MSKITRRFQKAYDWTRCLIPKRLKTLKGFIARAQDLGVTEITVEAVIRPENMLEFLADDPYLPMGHIGLYIHEVQITSIPPKGRKIKYAVRFGVYWGSSKGFGDLTQRAEALGRTRLSSMNIYEQVIRECPQGVTVKFIDVNSKELSGDDIKQHLSDLMEAGALAW
ncbi:hypothetical protein HGA91_02330 [candidate division WWE3 bacterium]|nr:hypothetical protein [candidate division WWE3 bacterium]